MKSTIALLALHLSLSLFGGISVGNDAFQIDFDDADHGFAVLGISNKLTHTYYAFDEVNQFGHLFSIDFRNADDIASDKSEVTIKESSRFRSKRAVKTPDGIELIYEGADFPGEANVVDVFVKIAVEPGLGRSLWTLEYENRSARKVGIVSRFPRLNRVLKDGEGDVLMPWSNHGARVFRKHSESDPSHERLRNGGYLGYRPMVTAFMKEGGGIYMAAEDPEARIKEITYFGHKPFFTTFLEVQKAPEGRNGPKYPVAITTFNGDWWQVARIYREWALKQEWTSKGRLLDRTDYPHRLCEIPYWVNVHDSGDHLDRVMDVVRKTFPDFRIGLHWHSWHRPPHCREYPDYFPAREGVNENVRHFQRINVEGNIYLDSQLWSEGIGDWSNAVKWATLNINGKDFNFERWAGVRNAVMCPATEFWQKEVQKFSMRVFDELGSDSIYQDQTGAASARTCYNTNHGHPIGGGNWWYEGYKKMFAPLKEHTSKVGGVITTEGTGEAYMSFIDGYLTVTELTPEDVPFFNAVYSGYTYYYGSPESMTDDDASFWAIQSREFLWGNALGWYGDLIPTTPAKCETVKRLCAVRMRFNDYFAYGQLLDELRPLSKVDRRRFGFRFRNKCQSGIYLPEVNGCWWKNGRNGKLALCAVNLIKSPMTVRFALPEGVSNLVAAELKNEKLPELSIKDRIATMTIAPNGLVFLESAD